MTRISWRLPLRLPTRLFADGKGPWGGGEPDDTPAAKPSPPRSGPNTPPPTVTEGPWGDQAPRRRPDSRFGNGGALDDLLRRGRQRFGGGGPRDPNSTSLRPDGSIIGWAIAALVLLWLVFTSMHLIAPQERGVVTRFGRYVSTLSPGVGITLPSPIDKVRKIDVEKIQTIDLGSEESETLMLTGDQNIIDIAYQVRFNIRSPEQYLFELAQPDETIRQVAESVMRAAIANVTLREAMGDKRGEIENRVQDEMQRVLDGYRSGVLVQGVAIKQADPPGAVNDAFKEVSAAQQQAQSYTNQARAYALQLTAKAQGEAVAFDKVYGQYKLAPEVTRKRMYYETMERVLTGVDKTIVDAPGVNSYQALPPVLRSLPKEPAK
ncbi:MAG: FtsH protease activity modulator HflK [Sphingomicrobium sp.]